MSDLSSFEYVYSNISCTGTEMTATSCYHSSRQRPTVCSPAGIAAVQCIGKRLRSLFLLTSMLQQTELFPTLY